MVKQITSPGWVHETSARTWCTGKTQRDRIEREVGGGIRMENTCKSMADSCWCVTGTTAMLWSDWPPTSENKLKKKKKKKKKKLLCTSTLLSPKEDNDTNLPL